MRPDIAERFQRVLACGIERADREHAEHLALLKPVKRDGRAASRERIR
jgi:hypothetical protein